MGNHYSPHDDAAAEKQEYAKRTGALMLSLISKYKPENIYFWKVNVLQRFKQVEEKVIGRRAVMELEAIKKEIQRFLSDH